YGFSVFSVTSVAIHPYENRCGRKHSVSRHEFAAGACGLKAGLRTFRLPPKGGATNFSPRDHNASHPYSYSRPGAARRDWRGGTTANGRLFQSDLAASISRRDV